MSNRERYHISARVEGDTITLREQLNRGADVPTTHLLFAPARPPEEAPVTVPVTVYWKTPLPDPALRDAVHQRVIAFCTNLYLERDYEGPVNCCL
jgi:hypothetical protein